MFLFFHIQLSLQKLKNFFNLRVMPITRLLFAQCREMDPLAVVFLYQLAGWVDSLAGFSQRLALRSQLLLMR